MKPVRVAESRSEDVILAFSAVNPSYEAGDTGQRFIFSGICTLISAALTLTVGFEVLAETLVIITYFCLVLGVVNLICEYRKEVKPKFRLPYPLRLPLSLTILTLLIYFSSSLSPIFLMT
ncbi:MAG: hypothetical protein QXN62_07110 [Candidatus Bathyarchaeia archaeon]|nr:hypothetical protein [Candidatus Bathyarchaeota archaeon]